VGRYVDSDLEVERLFQLNVMNFNKATHIM
jgi:hypothetical protein